MLGTEMHESYSLLALCKATCGSSNKEQYTKQ